jgi:hypothetical protein
VYVKIDIGKTVEHNKMIYYLLHNTIICYTMQLVSTKQWGHHQAKNKKFGDMKCTWKCLTGSRSVYTGLYLYINMYISISNERWTGL